MCKTLLARAGTWVRHEHDLLVAFRAKHPLGWVNKIQHQMHLAYFGMVFLEGHGIYAKIAGALLFLGVASIWNSEVSE